MDDNTTTHKNQTMLNKLDTKQIHNTLPNSSHSIDITPNNSLTVQNLYQDTHEDVENPLECSVDDTLKTSGKFETSIKSSNSQEPTIIPRHDRRGLFSNLILLDELANPIEYGSLKKTFILIIIAYAAIIGPMGGSVFLPAIEEICTEMKVGKDVVNISYGIYVLSLAFFPLWWSSFSEQFGRRNIYIVSFVAYLCFLVGCALVKNIGSLMALRFLAGGCAASVQAVGAGTLADIYIPTERGSAMGYFYLGPLLGPMLGPIFGGLIVERWGWRGTQWFLVIITGSIILSIVFFLPETLHRRVRSTSTPITSAKDLENNPVDTANLEKSQKENPDLSPFSKNSLLIQEPSSLNTKKVLEPSRQKECINSKRRMSISSLMSQLPVDDLDNSNVGDTFLPMIPSPSRVLEMEPEASNLNFQESDNKNTITDLEYQVSELEKTQKIKTTASEKERRLLNSSGQVDFQSLRFNEKLEWLIIRPLFTFRFLQYPPVTLTIIYGSICFMVLYFLNVGIETLYSASPYEFNSIYVGLCYIPNSIGYIISSIVAGRYSDFVVRREKKKLGYFNAESRFAEHVLLAMILYPISIILFGWTAYYKLHWVVPLVGSFLFGLSSMVVLGNSATYLIDALPGRGSSGIALNNFVRFIFAAIATFVAEPMKTGMGFGWMYTFLGLLAVVSSIAIFSIRKWGNKWRNEADFEKMYR